MKLTQTIQVLVTSGLMSAGFAMAQATAPAPQSFPAGSTGATSGSMNDDGRVYRQDGTVANPAMNNGMNNGAVSTTTPVQSAGTVVPGDSMGSAAEANRTPWGVIVAIVALGIVGIAFAMRAKNRNNMTRPTTRV